MNKQRLNIKSRLTNPGSKYKGFNPSNNLANRLGKQNIKKRLGDNKPIRKNNVKLIITKSINTNPNDARNKLIEKKRQNITDARDRLVEIAKKEDARVKLDKLKFTKEKANQNVNLVKKKKANFTLKSGLEGKTQLKAGSLVRTVSVRGGGTKQIQIRSRGNVDSNKARYHPLKNNPNVVTIKNESAKIKKTTGKRSSNTQLNLKRTIKGNPQPRYSSQERPPRERPQHPKNLSTFPVYNAYEGPVWFSHRQPTIAMPIQEVPVRPTQLRITAPNNYMDYYYPPPLSEVEARYEPSPRMLPTKRPIRETYEPYPPPKRQNITSEVVSILDQYMASNQGYKVMVTNLNHIVTQEDIDELFGNIGDIKNVRLIRDGIAEVTFYNEEDAYRSVDVYHNRQLDGQPMNVTVVTKKQDAPAQALRNRYSSPPSSGFSSQQQRQSVSSLIGSNAARNPPAKSVLRAAGGITNLGNQSMLGKRNQPMDVSPDISTIHQALFSGKSFSGPINNNQQFYVKLPKPPGRGIK